MKSKIPEDYQILDFAKIVRQTGELSSEDDIKTVTEEHKSLFNKLGEYPFSFHFIFDFTTFQYIAYSKSVIDVMGFDILKDGFEKALPYFHPTDRILLKEIHSKLFEYYFNTAEEFRSKLKFHFNYRIRGSNGSWIQLMQQSIITYAKNGAPVYDFSMCTDISAYKKDSNLTLVIFQLNEQGVYQKVFDFEINESWINEQYSLSKREIEIITLVANGDNAKEIADRLCLSVHTIHNHRKNILRKTNCKTFPEVISKIMVSGN